MLEIERRRDARYAIRFRTIIVVHSEAWAMLTRNVSFHGVFLLAPTAPQIGQLFRLVVNPDGDRPIALEVVPVRATQHDHDFEVGMRILAVPQRWERLVGELRDASPMGERIRRACLLQDGEAALEARRAVLSARR
jgi:hypothetical protein